MQHSAIHSSEETFLDTPTREKGQFTGDTVDISFATMIAAGDRGATKRAIREIIYSGTHSWKATSSGYCTAAPLPCSYANLAPRARERRLPERRQHARHPGLHAVRARLGVALLRAERRPAVLAASYDQLKSIANYVKTNIATTGNATGLVYNLFGGTSSYQYGIIDWPAQMRYGYTFNNNARAHDPQRPRRRRVRATAKVARALGKPDGRRHVRRLGGRAGGGHQREAGARRRALHRRPEPRPATRRSTTPPSTRRPTRSSTASRPRRTRPRCWTRSPPRA